MMTDKLALLMKLMILLGERKLHPLDILVHICLDGRLGLDFLPQELIDRVSFFSGLRPEVPPFVSDTMATLMQQCWHGDPRTRPEFNEVRKCFSNHIW